MTEFRDLSRLPDDPAYWEQLESKISGSLGPLVQAGAEAGQAWWSPITRQAWALGGLALAAALAVLLLAPPRDREPSATGWLPPPRNDPAVTAFLASDRPPSVATLIFLSGGGQ